MKRTIYVVLTVLVVVSSSNLASAAVVAYWNFDADFTDSASTHDLTANNGASIVAGGKIGGAASFDRALSQYARVDDTLFAIDGDFTVVAWYKTAIPDMGTERQFVFEDTNYAVSYGLRDLSGVDSGQIYTNTSTGTNFAGFAGGTSQEWHHIALTYLASSGLFTAYLDGAEAGSMTKDGTLDASTHFVIGGHRDNTGRNFHGMIDDVAVFDEVISTNYIGNLASGNPVPEPATLMLMGLGGLSLLRKRRA